MTERRMLDDDATETEATLLRAARAYRIPETTRQRTLTAVAVTTIAPSTANAAPSWWNARTKLAIGLASCGIMAGTFTWMTAREAPSPSEVPVAGMSAPSKVESHPTTDSRVESEPAASMVPAPQPPSVPVEALATVAAPGESVGRGNRVANTGSARAPQVDDADDAEALAAELAILDRTKRALENGDPSGALKQLETHDAQFRDGRLAPEATVLRIEALIASGDTRAAEQRALGFLAKHPKSPLAGRVRALVAAGRPTTGEADDK